MFGYYFGLALRSLRRNVVLTALMVITIGVGIGASMTTLSIFRAMSGDPIPQKSRQLFVPQIDNFGPTVTGAFGGALPADRMPRYLTYTDAVALMRAHAAERQAAMYRTSAAVASPNSAALPVLESGRATYTAFFTMFDVPFEYGAPWSAADDAARAPLVVLSRKLNDRLFGGANSVGRIVTLNDEEYRVAGVIQDWGPVPRFYDLGAGGGSTFAYFGAEQIFVPFTTAIARHLSQAGDLRCPKVPQGGEDALLHSECIMFQMWVELPNLASVRAYRTFLTNYAAEQRRLGRFNWAPRIALRDVRQWLAYQHVVSNDVSVLMLVSFAFLLVCLLNGGGLMLAKFMSRSPQVSVRRALGADSRAIFTQCLVETGMIGLVAGVVGIALSIVGLLIAQGMFIRSAGNSRTLAALTHLNGGDVVIAVVLSVAATLLAGLYPTWRATRVQPAWQLKVQ
ncbi:MAG TPA: ABC transporter permease [Steroidobacteraceae bacterium]|jgi:putative ABC transport system permease protein|nr:ABC transporter permease [Steroidobacteraceae bacterium]